MCTNISQDLLGGGFLAAFDVRNGIPPQEKLVDGDQVSSDDEFVGLDLYNCRIGVSRNSYALPVSLGRNFVSAGSVEQKLSR